LNTKSPMVDSIFDFKKALLYAHEFQGDIEDENGWISVAIDFKEPVDSNLSIGTFNNI